MHFFRYGAQGEVLAIVLPPRVQKNSGVKEGDEYEFLEVTPGVFLLLNKQAAAAPKGALVGKIAEKLFEGIAPIEGKGEKGEKIIYSDFKPATQYTPSTEKQAMPARVITQTSSSNYSSYKPSSGTQVSSTGEKAFWEQKIDLQGYAIVDEANSHTVSQQLEARVKKGEVVGVKGFDKKLYICERGFYEQLATKLKDAKLPKEFSTQQAAEATKVGEPACTAVLSIMKEGGDVLEKKKGMYKLVK